MLVDSIATAPWRQMGESIVSAHLIILSSTQLGNTKVASQIFQLKVVNQVVKHFSISLS